MTFNHQVPGSSPGALTKTRKMEGCPRVRAANRKQAAARLGGLQRVVHAKSKPSAHTRAAGGQHAPEDGGGARAAGRFGGGRRASGGRAPCANPDALGVSRILTVDTSRPLEVGTFDFARTLPLNDMEVVLTIDDGPLHGVTEKVLAALRAACGQATFFVVGQMAAAAPDLVRAEAADGPRSARTPTATRSRSRILASTAAPRTSIAGSRR